MGVLKIKVGETWVDYPSGPQGDPGPGVAPGGNPYQVLVKNSTAPYDTGWGINPPMFDSKAALDAGLVNPVNGQHAYTHDTGSEWVYANGVWQWLSRTTQCVVTLIANKTVIPGSGGQVVFNMAGWAVINGVSASIITGFYWTTTISSIQLTQVNVRCYDTPSGTNVSDNATVLVSLVVVGTPNGNVMPSIS